MKARNEKLSVLRLSMKYLENSPTMSQDYLQDKPLKNLQTFYKYNQQISEKLWEKDIFMESIKKNKVLRIFHP